ncbi:MAG: hypothetical protein J1E65_01335 [Lachnospiraceae bacterium]|nr:hypothetical protein [Lachnospiraceae bacterium]
MKVFKRVSMLICVVSVLTLFSMTVMAANFPILAYNVKKNTFDYTSYTNPTSQSPYNVKVSTRPDSVNGLAEVKISTIDDFSNDNSRIGYQAFPGGFDVPAIEFVLPAGKTYYAFVYTNLDFYVSGILNATY